MSKLQRMENDLVIAGAGAEGHGVLTGWHGRGGMPYARLVEIAKAAGIPAEHMPKPKNAATQLARAVKASAGAYDVKPGAVDDDEARIVSRWWVVRPATQSASAGDVAGAIVLVVSLVASTDDSAPALVFDSRDEALAQTIRMAFDERVGGEELVAADVTTWLVGVHRDMLNAVRYGVGWYVPRARRQIAESIVAAFVDAGWGENWMNPPCPVATSAQMAVGIANGLIAEVGEVMLDLVETRRAIQSRKGPAADIGARAAETYMIRFSRVGARMTSYAHTLGKDQMAACREAIHDAMIMLDGVLEGGITADWNGVWAGIEAAGRRLVQA